jgi:hypothetical protein
MNRLDGQQVTGGVETQNGGIVDAEYGRKTLKQRG